MSTTTMKKGSDLTKESFTANGNRYTYTNSISIARFKEYEKLQIEMGYGVGFKEIFDRLRELFEVINEMRFAEAAVLCHNIMNGVAEAADENRIHPALMLCTLVLNRDDEDTKAYDESICRSKIEDWRKEGIDMQCFFSLALNSIHGFRESYQIAIQDTFQKLTPELGKFKKE